MLIGETIVPMGVIVLPSVVSSSMDCATPSLSQAQRMRRMSEERRLGEGDIEDIMAEIKGNQVDCIRITVDRFREHFKRDVSPMEMATTIDKALEYYQRYLERQRDER